MEELSITENAIKNYFLSVLEKSKSGEKFPVSLDYVWPISYSDKGKAVRALTSDFIEDVDYKVFTINGKNPNGGRPENIYKLSVPCLEFFIARKVRPIFDVYREVFHKASELGSFIMPSSFAEALQLAADQQKQIEQQARQIEESLPKVEFVDRLVDSKENLTVAQFAKLIGSGQKRLFEKLRERKILMSGGSKHNQPYQRFIDEEYFVVKEKLVGPNTNQKPYIQTFIAPKGQTYLLKIL